jgi:hypothetical protein
LPTARKRLQDDKKEGILTLPVVAQNDSSEIATLHFVTLAMTKGGDFSLRSK